MTKDELRKKYITLRKNLSEEKVLQKSQKIFENLQEIQKVQNAKSVALYAAVNNEVDTANIIKKFTQSNISVFLPKFFDGKWVFSKFESWEKMRSGYREIFEPEDLILPQEDFDLAILPGVAFDQSGTRLGYGKGVYDKLLAKSRAVKIGLCFDFQVIEKLPREKHDLVMDYVVTEKRII